jgi:hypothetical protein
MKKLLLALALCLGSPALAQQSVFVPATTADFNVTATTALVEIAPAVTGKSIYLTQITLRLLTTSVLTLTHGTGTNCATGTPIAFFTYTAGAAAETLTSGTGNGALFIVPQGRALCITVATAAASGWVSWAQF